MKTNPTLNWLVPVVFVLGLIVAGAGLFWHGPGSHVPFTSLHGQAVELYGRGVYKNDTTFTAAGFRGTDMITFFVALPLLAIAYLLYRRGSLRGGLFMASMVAYFLYIGASMTLGAAYNNLLLVYIALLSAGLFAFVLAVNAIDLQALPAHITPRLPRRGIATFMFIAGGATLLLWLSEILGPLARGEAPVLLASYTTVITFGLDLGVITPAALVTGWLVMRKVPVGYVLAAVLMILNALIGLAVIGQTVFQLNAGIVFTPGQMIGMIGSWVVMGLFAVGLTIGLFRGLEEKPVLKTKNK